MATFYQQYSDGGRFLNFSEVGGQVQAQYWINGGNTAQFIASGLVLTGNPNEAESTTYTNTGWGPASKVVFTANPDQSISIIIYGVDGTPFATPPVPATSGTTITVTARCCC